MNSRRVHDSLKGQKHFIRFQIRFRGIQRCSREFEGVSQAFSLVLEELQGGSGVSEDFLGVFEGFYMSHGCFREFKGVSDGFKAGLFGVIGCAASFQVFRCASGGFDVFQDVSKHFRTFQGF